MNDEKIVTIICNPVRVRIGDYFPAEFEIINAKVAVDVPLTRENFHNFSILVEGVEDSPVLTTKGFRWCYNQLRDMMAPEPEPEEPSGADEEWN